MLICFTIFFFFFSSRRRHTRSTRDWSSDVLFRSLGEQLEEAAGRPHRAGLVRALEQDAEFVTTETRDGVTRPRGRRESRRHLAQELIPGVVAEAVVHLLESVKVDE